MVEYYQTSTEALDDAMTDFSSPRSHLNGGRDPHDLLGVPQGADRQQVLRAFHRKARRGGHPDTGGDAQTFQEIVRARDALLDQARQAAKQPGPRAAHVATAPKPGPRPAPSRPGQTTRHAGPTGQGDGSVVPFFLLVLGVLALPVLLRILSLIFIP